MRRWVKVLFDGVVAGTPGSLIAYTDIDVSSVLGACDVFALQSVADRVIGFTRYTVAEQFSGDGLNWIDVTPVLIDQSSMTANVTFSAIGYGSRSTIASGSVRLAITVTTGTAGSMHLRIMGCGRDRARGQPSAPRGRVPSSYENWRL